jgi:Fasciclin domain
MNIVSQFLANCVPSQVTRLADGSVNSTFLVPNNSALQNLHRKPWEDEDEVSRPDQHGSMPNDDMWNREVEEKARQNVENFVAGHLITRYPIQPDADLPTMKGPSVSYRIENGVKYVRPGNAKVLGEREAANGAIWVLDGVLE